MQCTGCGSSEVEWLDTWCQECWEAHCNEAWWEMIAAITPPQVYSPTLRRCGNCEHFQDGFCHLPDWEDAGVQPRSKNDPSCLGWLRKDGISDCDDRDPIRNHPTGRVEFDLGKVVSDPF